MTVWHTREYKIIVFPTWQFKIPQRCPSETVLISIIHGFHCTRCGFCYMAEWGEVSFNIDCASFFDTFNLKMKSFHNYYITVVTPFSVSCMTQIQRSDFNHRSGNSLMGILFHHLTDRLLFALWSNLICNCNPTNISRKTT